MKKLGISLIIVDVIALICFFIVYGPIKYPKEFWITTSMRTKSHHYLAHIFYSNKTIDNVMSKNVIYEFTTGSDASQIVFKEDNSSYSNVYEKELLEHDENQVYKILELSINGCKVFLTAIYDSSRVELASTKYLGSSGQTITNMCKDNDGLVCINAGGFIDTNWVGNGGSPTGIMIKDGKVVYSGGNASGGLIGFNKDNVLVLTYQTAQQAVDNGMIDAVQFGPFLVVNGVPVTIKGNGGWGIHPRSVIAQRKDGVVLFLIVDGNSKGDLNFNGRGGASMNDLIEILMKYGAYNAANLDGGASTSMAVEGKLYNHPLGGSVTGERRLPNAWIVK